MNNSKNIVIFSASEVKNLELAESFKKSLEDQNVEATIINLVDLELPLYSSRTESLYKGEELLSKELPVISHAQAFIFIAPEYNGSTPPVFNNFLAWLSRSSKNWREYLNGKPAAIATFSGGGGFNVLLAMRTQLSFIGMNVLGRQILTHSNKALDEKSLLTITQELVSIGSPR